jgi:hypothetical protein
MVRDFGSLGKGYEWGVRGLLLKQISEKEFAPNGLPYTEEKELFIGKDKDTGKFYAYYTLRILGTDGISVIKYKQMKFVEGNPNPVWIDACGF